MTYKERRPASWQTPEQQQIQLEIWRRHDEDKRLICDTLEFWRACDKGVCRRMHGCKGDPHECFQRGWEEVPEEDKQWLRDAIVAWREAGRPSRMPPLP